LGGLAASGRGSHSLAATRVDCLFFVRGFLSLFPIWCRLGREGVITTRKTPADFFGPRSTWFLPLMGGDGDYAQYWHPECRLIILSASRPFDDDRGKKKTTTDSAFFAPEARTGKDESRVRRPFLGGRTFFPLFRTRRNGSDELSIGSSPTMRCWTESRAFIDVASQTRRL